MSADESAAPADVQAHNPLFAIPDIELPEGESVAGVLSRQRREFASYTSDGGPDGVQRLLIAKLDRSGEIVFTELASLAPRRAIWRRRPRRSVSRVVVRTRAAEQAYRAVVAVIASWLRHGHRLDIPSAPVGLEEFRHSAALAAARPRASR